MSKSLVIVESPAKAKTIAKILGNNFEIIPSMGHIVDLPKTKMGVDIENGFKPSFIVAAKRRKILSQIKSAAKNADTIYLATDPDREGEAIGWHIKDKLNQKNKHYHRVVFHEITPQAIKEAFNHPIELDAHKVNAQTGRRVLDRLVGDFLSPLLWRKIAGGLSAGRVQSVALRLIVEREKEILAFKPEEYWSVVAILEKDKIYSENLKNFVKEKNLEDNIAKLKYGGDTYIEEGILKAVEMLQNSGGSKNIIFISDGKTQHEDESKNALGARRMREIRRYDGNINSSFREDTCPSSQGSR